MKFSIYFAAIAAFLFCLFFFYSVEIYEGTITASGASIDLDLSLRALFFGGDLPEGVLLSNVQSIAPTFKGWLLLGVIHLGLPSMLAYRFAFKPAKETQNNS